MNKIWEKTMVEMVN